MLHYTRCGLKEAKEDEMDEMSAGGRSHIGGEVYKSYKSFAREF